MSPRLMPVVTEAAAGARGRDWFGMRLHRKCSADAVADSAAALGYYLLFSLFPFLLFVVEARGYSLCWSGIVASASLAGSGIRPSGA